MSVRELEEGGPVLNPPAATEVLDEMRARYGRLAVVPAPAPTSWEEEIRAMEEASRLLSGLDKKAAMRAATWLFDRYGPRLEDGS